MPAQAEKENKTEDITLCSHNLLNNFPQQSPTQQVGYLAQALTL